MQVVTATAIPVGQARRGLVDIELGGAVRRTALEGYKDEFDDLFSKTAVAGSVQRQSNYVDPGDLLSVGYAFVFYVLDGVVNLLDLIGMLIRSVSDDYFNLVAQYFVISCFVLNGVWILLGYVEAHGMAKKGDKALAELEKEGSADGLVEAAAVGLKNGIKARKVQAAVAFVGSPGVVLGAVLALVLQYRGQIIKPLHRGSGALDISLMALNLYPAVLGVPFYVGVGKGCYDKIKESRELMGKIEALRETVTDKDLLACLDMIEREQRVKEMAFRLVTMLLTTVDLVILSAWCTFQFIALGGVEWAAASAAWLNAPMLWMFFSAACLAVLNAGIKMVADGQRAWAKRSAYKGLEQDASQGALENVKLLRGDGGELKELCRSDKRFGIYVMIKKLISDKDSGMFKGLGFSDEDINKIKLVEGEGKETWEYAKYLVASRLGLVDTV